MNQTRPHVVNQMGKTHSKPLAARHGRGTAWERHAMCESALRRRSAAARLLELPVRIPPGTWMSFSCECYVLSCRDISVGLDHSSRGVLPRVVCLWSRNLEKEEAWAH
jgi:hypothetical protein